MAEIADLEQRIAAIDEQLKTTRKRHRRAARSLKKARKQAEAQRENLREMFSGYAETTELERQGYQGLTEWEAREASYESQLANEIRQLESQRKLARKTLKKAQRARAKAQRAEPVEGAAPKPTPPPQSGVLAGSNDQWAVAGLCELCGLHAMVALGMCSLCLELAEAQRTGDFSGLSPAAVSHAISLGMQLERDGTKKKPTGMAADAAACASRFRQPRVALTAAISSAAAGAAPDAAGIGQALQPLRDTLEAGGPPAAASFVESSWQDAGAPEDIRDAVWPYLPDWLTGLLDAFSEHEYNPKRHYLTLDDPMNYGTSRVSCSECGIEGEGAEFYFANDGGVCGPAECRTCGLSKGFHSFLGWLSA